MRRSLLNVSRAFYLAIRNTHLLESAIGRRIFIWLYDWYKKWIEDPFLQLGRRHPGLFVSGHILDVGANQGYTTQVFAALRKDPFKLFAFEPDPVSYAFLRQRVERRALTAVELIPLAAGAVCGDAQLFRSPIHLADHRLYWPHDRKEFAESKQHAVAVKLVTLDGFCREQGITDSIGFVKIDVQGFELEVLKGMVGLISANPGMKIALEVDAPSLRDAGTSVAELQRFLRDQRLGCQLIEPNGKLREIAVDDLGSIADRHGYIDVLLSKISGAPR